MLSRLRIQVSLSFLVWWLALELAVANCASVLVVAAKQGPNPLLCLFKL